MKRRRRITSLCLGLTLLLSLRGVAASSGGTASRVDFNREIRGILADNCYACHGPDEQARKSRVRLDQRQAALSPMKSGERAIVPGAPAQSKLFERISSKDPDEVMPPPKTGKTLKPAQIELFRKWIAEGADWPVHWSFVPPRRAPLPEVKNKRWLRNLIDSFVLSRLESEGATPAPEADKPTLARRVTLDLTGLPPTIEEVDAFLSDKTSGAYEKLVDRLLASPRYGEHLAKSWLDAARYADSHGFHIDSQRDIWAYRDWVVQAFNENKPFDQFTTEQLAGDLLPNATTAQKVASGFIRCNMSTGEGGAIEAEYAAKYAFDRVETTSATWLGLTMVCSRCHAHKYDPITHREYYGLYAFFNNLDEPVMDGNKKNPDPYLSLPSKEQSERLEWLKKHIADGERRLAEPVTDLDAAQAVWAAAWHDRLRASWRLISTSSLASSATNGAHLTRLEDGSVLAQGSAAEKETYELTMRLDAGDLAALRLDALPHASLPHQASGTAEDGSFMLSELEAELLVKGADGSLGAPQKLHFASALADSAASGKGIGNALDGKPETGWGVDAAAATAPHTALFLLAEPLGVPGGGELHVRLRFEGSVPRQALGHFRFYAASGGELPRWLSAPQLDPWQVIGPFKTEGLRAGFDQAYEPEQEIELKKGYAGVTEEVRWAARGDLEDGKTHVLVDELHGVHGAYYLYRTVQAPASARMEFSLRADDLFKVWLNDGLVLERSVPLKVGEPLDRVGLDLISGTNRILIKIVNHQGYARFAFSPTFGSPVTLQPEVAAILSTGTGPVGEWQTKVRNYYRRQHSPEFGELFVNLDQWREEQPALEQSIPTTLVAKERATPRDTFVLMRGEYDRPGEKVIPSVPSVLPPLPKDAPTNRLGLARWLVDPSHPLTARVTVNRFWQQVFGVGLVKTTEDFGVQGERPSHPELLDWLATEFVRTGWDVKGLHRLLVTSATYRQASGATPEWRLKDPENRLLAHGPRFRVEAEVLRDTMLYVSGLLVEQRGGKSVKPFEPPGLWEAVSYNHSQKYDPDHGDAQYRRSLYTYWKRQSPPPNMLTFDASTREFCVVRRPRTNTPLQALALLNDPQYVEAARALAQRMIVEGGPDAAKRIARGFRLATGRQPAKDEIQILVGILQKQMAEYRNDHQAASLLLGVGDFSARKTIAPAELAAWTTIAGILLNLDETITKG